MIDKTVLSRKFTTMKKCVHCKEYVTLEKECDSVLYYGTTEKNKAFYHVSCLKKKMLSKKGGKVSAGDVDILVEDLRLDSEGYIEDMMYRSHLLKFLQEKYNVIGFTKSFYTKMDKIYNGTFKDMSRGIPAKHIFDIFQRSNKVDSNFRRLEGENLVHYHLGTVLKEYPSYLNWLGKREVSLKQVEEKSLEERPDIEVVSISNRKEIEVEEEDIFSDID